MKKLLGLLAVLLFVSHSYSQVYNQNLNPNEGLLYGGLGLNWIDGQLYYSFHMMPEIAFSKIGVGLDLSFDVNSSGKLRHENFNEFSDYLSIIRYVRYGQKDEPVYIKLGALDYYTLGYGNIMYLYNNCASYDTRKDGLICDLDFGDFGFESIYSSFGEAGVVGVRGHVKPLKFTTAGDIPIIGNIEAGVSFASDFNDKAGVVSGLYDHDAKKFNATDDKGSINIYSFDVGLPLLTSKYLGIKLYADYTKIANFGDGEAAGLLFNVNGLGLFNGSLKFERRFNNDKYIAGYFNSLYETERFSIDTTNDNTTRYTSNNIKSKAATLNSAHGDKGYYGELGINVLGFFNIVGSYQRLDKDPNSGILHITTDVLPKESSAVVRAGYDKRNIKDEKDLFTLDDRSYLYAEVGYKPMPYLLISMLYNWTFTPVRDADDNVIDFKSQKKIEPRISFIYPFNTNSGGTN
jgi:hypothetical protein